MSDSINARIDAVAASVAHLQELVMLRLDKEEQARQLQAAEYERRLSELNDSRAEARERFADYIDRDYYNVQHGDLEKRVDANTSQLIGLSTIPGDIRALFAWREDVTKVLSRIEAMGVDIRTLLAFREDITTWRSRVMGIAIGVGTMAGLVSGAATALFTHWMSK